MKHDGRLRDEKGCLIDLPNQKHPRLHCQCAGFSWLKTGCCFCNGRDC